MLDVWINLFNLLYVTGMALWLADRNARHPLWLAASVLLALRELLRAERRTLQRFAARSREEGLLPAALAEQLPSWRKRWRPNWAGHPRARRRLLRFASRLGIIEARLEAAPSRGLARRTARLRDKVVEQARKAAPPAG